MASRFSVSLLAVGLTACASRAPAPTTPDKIVDMEALRIVAKHDADGHYSFESYDAEELFARANAELDAGRCTEAVSLYDRITAEFAASGFASASYYNAGLCLAQAGAKEEALRRFEGLLARLPESPDVKHASFQAGHLQAELGQWAEALQQAEALLARADLDPAERVEAMTLRAQVMLGLSDIKEAAHQAQQALTYARSLSDGTVPDPFYVAGANFVVAETLRLQAEELVFPDSTQDEQREVLVRRAQLLLDAQREYFNAIRYGLPHWSALSGQRIGGMYRQLWLDIVAAPVPGNVPVAVRSVYPEELGKMIKPLLQHAIRYWELALKMVEGEEALTEWAAETRRDLQRTRALVASPLTSEAPNDAIPASK